MSRREWRDGEVERFFTEARQGHEPARPDERQWRKIVAQAERERARGRRQWAMGGIAAGITVLAVTTIFPDALHNSPAVAAQDTNHGSTSTPLATNTAWTSPTPSVIQSGAKLALQPVASGQAQDLPKNATLLSMSSVDGSSKVAVARESGSSSALLRSPGGSDGWSVVARTTDTSLRGARFADYSHGWAWTDRQLLQTTNGGASWDLVADQVNVLSLDVNDEYLTVVFGCPKAPDAGCNSVRVVGMNPFATTWGDNPSGKEIKLKGVRRATVAAIHASKSSMLLLEGSDGSQLYASDATRVYPVQSCKNQRPGHALAASQTSRLVAVSCTPSEGDQRVSSSIEVSNDLGTTWTEGPLGTVDVDQIAISGDRIAFAGTDTKLQAPTVQTASPAALTSGWSGSGQLGKGRIVSLGFNGPNDLFALEDGRKGGYWLSTDGGTGWEQRTLRAGQ